MQLWKISALALYLGSYLPLSVILLVQDTDLNTASHGFCGFGRIGTADCVLPLQHPLASVGAVLFCAVCLAFTIFALRLLPTGHRITVTESKHIPADLINYVFPYIVAFIALDFSSATRLLGFFVFLLWMYSITYKSGQIAMNPALAVFGWKLFEVKYRFIQSTDEMIGRVLSTVEIEPNHTYDQTAMQDVIIVRAGPRE